MWVLLCVSLGERSKLWTGGMPFCFSPYFIRLLVVISMRHSPLTGASVTYSSMQLASAESVVWLCYGLVAACSASSTEREFWSSLSRCHYYNCFYLYIPPTPHPQNVCHNPQWLKSGHFRYFTFLWTLWLISVLVDNGDLHFSSKKKHFALNERHLDETKHGSTF